MGRSLEKIADARHRVTRTDDDDPPDDPRGHVGSDGDHHRARLGIGEKRDERLVGGERQIARSLRFRRMYDAGDVHVAVAIDAGVDRFRDFAEFHVRSTGSGVHQIGSDPITPGGSVP